MPSGTRDGVSHLKEGEAGFNSLYYCLLYQILHGDLAARNVLLTEGNIVKICDFGLSKILKQGGGSYTKKSDTPMPVKWLALETLNYR